MKQTILLILSATVAIALIVWLGEHGKNHRQRATECCGIQFPDHVDWYAGH